MIDSVRDLADVLVGTLLEGREIAEIPILDTGEKAYSVAISGDEVETAWRIGRAFVLRTRRWPIVSTFWNGGGSTWTARVQEEDFFARFYYQEAPHAGDISPRALCALASAVDLSAFLERKAARRAARSDLDAVIAYALEETKARCGAAPNQNAVKAAQVDGHLISMAQDVERFLLAWEASHGVSLDPEHARQEWFQPDSAALLLLPTLNGWDTLAYIHWFGTSDYGAEHYIALGHSWERRFGAELVAHYGTMLQCLVSRPPTTIHDAWTVACEHDLAGECTLALPGIRLRDYTRALIGWDRWFLHERP